MYSNKKTVSHGALLYLAAGYQCHMSPLGDQKQLVLSSTTAESEQEDSEKPGLLYFVRS